MSVRGCNALLQCIVEVVRWIPVAFVALILCWAYYAYVVELCCFVVENWAEKLFYLVSFHALFVLLVWSYWKTVFSSIVTPPEEFRLPSHVLDEYLRADKAKQHEILDHFASTLPVTTRSYTEGVRYCPKCVMLKPDRAHHCGVCGVCLLKMDHHCPWVNACVHFGNYKFFVLFLGYSFLFCLFIMCTDLQYFILSWGHDYRLFLHKQKSRFQVMFLFFIAAIFSVSVGCLFIFHLYLTWKNRTTLEACYAPLFRYGGDKDGFNLGIAKNFRQVFGEFGLQAFLPFNTTPGNGIVFPTRWSHGHVTDYRTLESMDGLGNLAPRNRYPSVQSNDQQHFTPVIAEGQVEGEPAQSPANLCSKPHLEGWFVGFHDRPMRRVSPQLSANGMRLEQNYRESVKDHNCSLEFTIGKNERIAFENPVIKRSSIGLGLSRSTSSSNHAGTNYIAWDT